MEIILEKTVPKLGLVGEVVKVSDGFARNYLLPKKFAVKATKHNLVMVANRVKVLREKELQEEAIAKELAKQLEGMSFNIQVKASEEGKLFGSVTELDIVSALKEKGYDLEKKNISLKDHIKYLGVYSIPLKLHALVQADIKVWVIREANS